MKKWADLPLRILSFTSTPIDKCQQKCCFLKKLEETYFISPKKSLTLQKVWLRRVTETLCVNRKKQKTLVKREKNRKNN